MTTPKQIQIGANTSEDDYFRGARRRDPGGSYRDVDPLKAAYHDSILQHPDRLTALHGGRAALLCIDLQYLDAAPGYGVFADAAEAGVPVEAQESYFDALERYVLPRVQHLQQAFRRNSLEIVHIRIRSETRDGRDRSPGHKRLGLHAAPGSREADFLEQVAPQGDELIVNKTASGVFTSTNLDFLLRNMNIETVYICGVYTDECVSTAVRDASDLGYFVTLVQDACATVTPDLHQFSIAVLKDRYARIASAEKVVEELDARPA